MKAEEIAKEHINPSSGNDDYYIPERRIALAKDIEEYAKQEAIGFEKWKMKNLITLRIEYTQLNIKTDFTEWSYQKFKQDEYIKT